MWASIFRKYMLAEAPRAQDSEQALHSAGQCLFPCCRNRRHRLWAFIGLLAVACLLPAVAVRAAVSDSLRQKAAAGDAVAQMELGRAYLNGRGVPKDYQLARQWLEKAAGQGNARARTALGWMYEHGRGVEKDYGRAFALYEKAARAGYDRAQRPLGKFYELGLGVARDPARAAYWYRKAAEQGNARAQANLGILYETGVGVERDYDQALYWYRRSTGRGYPRGQYLLGRMYEQGLGVEKDLAAARSWYEKAAKSRYSRAIARLKELERKSAGRRTASRQTTTGEPPSAPDRRPRPDRVAAEKPVADTPVGRPPAAGGQSGDAGRSGALPVLVEPDRQETPEDDTVSLAENHFYLGNSLAREGRFQEAIAEYRRSLELEPDNGNTLENLGITYAKLGRVDEGVRIMERAVRVDPLDPGKYASLGIMLHAIGREDKALARYRQAIRHDPTQNGVYYNMAVIFAGRQDYDRAWRSLQLAERFGYRDRELRSRLKELAPEPRQQWTSPADGLYLRGILVASRAEAEDIRSRLLAGEDMAQLARRSSLAATRLQGGYMGFVRKTEMTPEVSVRLQSLEPFAFSPVIETDDGFHIFQVLVMPEDILSEDSRESGLSAED